MGFTFSLFNDASSNSKKLCMHFLGMFIEEKEVRAEDRTDFWLHMNNLFQRIRFKYYRSDKMKMFSTSALLRPWPLRLHHGDGPMSFDEAVRTGGLGGMWRWPLLGDGVPMSSPQNHRELPTDAVRLIVRILNIKKDIFFRMESSTSRP